MKRSMKRFFIVSAVLAVTFVALSMEVLPVRCMHCGRTLFQTDVCSALSGGCGGMMDGCRHASAAPEGQTSPRIAAGTPAPEIQTGATTDRPS